MTWLDELTLDTVTVHMTDDGPSLKGVLAARHDDCLVLKEAVVLEENHVAVLNGDVVVPREKVLFMQVAS